MRGDDAKAPDAVGISNTGQRGQSPLRLADRG